MFIVFVQIYFTLMGEKKLLLSLWYMPKLYSLFLVSFIVRNTITTDTTR